MLENTVYKSSATLIAGQVQVDFTDFAVYDETHLAVYVDEVLQTSGYTVTLTDATLPSRGNVVFDTAPGAGKVVVLKPEPPLTQTLNFINNESTPALLQNRSLDLIVQTLQNFSEQLGRCAKSGINTDEPGDAIDWTTIIGTGSITAAMLNADVTTLINGLIAAEISDFQTSAQVQALIEATSLSSLTPSNLDFKYSGSTVVTLSSSTSTFYVGVASGCTGYFVNSDYTATRGLRVTDDGNIFIQLSSPESGAFDIKSAATSGTVTMQRFFDGAGTQCGGITLNATANTVAYATSSDERLKTAIEDFDALEILRAITPKKYERISNPGIKEYGHLAQKLLPFLPQAVIIGDADLTKKGAKPYMVDYSQTTPILWAAVAQLDKIVDKFKKRVKALEKLLNVEGEEQSWTKR